MLAILGASGFSLEVKLLLEQCGENLDYFVDKDDSALQGCKLGGVQVLSMSELHELSKNNTFKCVYGIGSGDLRRKIKADLKNSIEFDKVVHPSAIVHNFSHLPNDVVICAGSIITSNVDIAEGCVINMGCIIAHDVKVGRYVTMSPGVRVSGNVVIEDDVFLGAGSIITDGTPENPIIIGKGSFIASGAVVTKSVSAGAKVYGFPSKYF